MNTFHRRVVSQSLEEICSRNPSDPRCPQAREVQSGSQGGGGGGFQQQVGREIAIPRNVPVAGGESIANALSLVPLAVNKTKEVRFADTAPSVGSTVGSDGVEFSSVGMGRSIPLMRTIGSIPASASSRSVGLDTLLGSVDTPRSGLPGMTDSRASMTFESVRDLPTPNPMFRSIMSDASIPTQSYPSSISGSITDMEERRLAVNPRAPLVADTVAPASAASLRSDASTVVRRPLGPRARIPTLGSSSRSIGSRSVATLSESSARTAPFRGIDEVGLPARGGLGMGRVEQFINSVSPPRPFSESLPSSSYSSMAPSVAESAPAISTTEASVGVATATESESALAALAPEAELL
jgi:hypothetical protein